MTTNLIECINSVLKGARNLPVLALVRATYYQLNKLSTQKSVQAHDGTRLISEKVSVIDLARRICDCGHFQVERLPCRHVIACCANQCLDWQLYVHDVYKMTEVRKVYRFEFTPIGDPKTWPAYEGPTLVGNPTLRRMSKGHAKLTRYLNEMDSRDMRGPRLCRLSGAQGHSRSRCPQRARPSGAGE
ncbi:uncharacterized protein [Arachis hypogaea]|uniref:uncharacterized protein n=1 Tax=Arachis hypogaea TaxID=3818 RepID=UPI0010FC549C|nr:uncharacterized protein LOC114924760 [Arachis hypogaea]